MRPLFFALALIALVGLVAAPRNALAQCEGSAGTATINTAGWTAQCVIAGFSPDCLDSLGNAYECFQIVGSNGSDPSYNTVALFFGEPPVQGQTYDLGGTSPNGAMVVGEMAFAVTSNAPYTGQVTVNVFNTGSGSFDCTFHFQAQSIFFGPDVDVVDGHFSGTVVAVEPTTWTDFKAIYK